MIRLIGIDLDGTLLTDEKIITAKTTEVLTRAAARNIMIVPTTGRPLAGMPAELSPRNGIHFAITSNGAVTYDLENHCLICGKYIAPRNVARFFEIVHQPEIVRSVYMDGIGYQETKDQKKIERIFSGTMILPYLQKSRRIVPDLPEFARLREYDNVENISLMFPDQDLLNETREKLTGALDHVRIVQTYPTELEITDEEADKGLALRELGARLRVPKQEIMGIGDSMNDIGLFMSAGVSVAMGNANAETKKAADYVTAGNDEDGVACVIEKLVLQL